MQSHKKKHRQVNDGRIHSWFKCSCYPTSISILLCNCVPPSIKPPQQVSLSSASTKAVPCNISHLPHQRLRRQKSPFSGLWWPLTQNLVVLQGKDPKAKDAQLGSVFYNELYRLRGDITENLTSKYFSKAGSAHFFHQICILLRLKAFKNRLCCVGGTYLTDIKYSTAISIGLKLAASPQLPTRSSAQVGAGGYAKSVCEKQEE